MTRTDVFSVENRVAIVTGASAGLGRRMATVLHAAGARVAVVARRESLLRELAEELDGTLALTHDLADHEGLGDIVRRTEEELGAVDILVNNAGLLYGAKAEEETPEHLLKMLQVNLIAPFLLSQLVFPSMARRGAGVIINVTSIVAHVGIGRLPQAGYASTKGGLSALTRELAAQWARDGIRVNAIAPGFFESEIVVPLLDEHPHIREFIHRGSMIKRVGRPEDFDGALLYLASDASSFVTGETLMVDGGWAAR